MEEQWREAMLQALQLGEGKEPGRLAASKS